MMHKLHRPAFFFKIHFYYGRSSKKDVPTKEVKNSFTPHKNIVKEIQRLPTKEASVLLQFIELPCCFFRAFLLFFDVYFFVHGGHFLDKTLPARFRNIRVTFPQFLPKSRSKLNLIGIQNSCENILACF